MVDASYNEACTTLAPQAGVPTFTDDKGWVAGLEFRDGSLYNRLRDSSVVVPSVNGAPYTTRIVNPDGTPATDLYGLDFGAGITGTGNPADSGVGYGTVINVAKAMKGNLSAQVKITPPTP
jgi:immune inhibitor A